MALFNAAALLEDTPEPKTIVCDFFQVPKGVEFPTITLEMTDKLREVYRHADEKYRQRPEYVYKKSQKFPTGTIVNNFRQFCHEILNEGYKDSEGLIDQPSKKAILALLKKEPGFTRKLASKLVELFEHDDLFQDEEETGKN